MNQPHTFEKILQQNERRIHYQLHRLNLRDDEQEFLQEGIIAMWNAYEKYDPDKGPMATYFNYTIRDRLIDHIRQKQRYQSQLSNDTSEKPTRKPPADMPHFTTAAGQPYTL